jgi:hypothetical protein
MAIPYNADRHDLGFLRADGTTKVGFMLARQKDTSPCYSVTDDEYLAQQQTQLAGYEGLPYEKELRIGQDDWRSGYGQEIYDRNDPKRYLYSQDVDCRFSHKIIPSPADCPFTLPVLPVITNAGFEAGDISGWTESVASFAIDHTNPRTLLHAVALNANAAGYQQIAVGTGIVGGEIVFKMWVKSANAMFIRVTDSIGGSTSSAAHSGGGAYEQLTVNHVITAASTWIRLWIIAPVGGGGYADDATISVYGTQTVQEHFNGSLYFNAGKCLLKLSVAGAVTFLKDMDTTITSLKGFTDANLYIGLGLATDYQYMAVAETFTVSNAVVKRFNFFEVLDATSPTMYGSDSANTIRSTVDPTNGGTAWSATTTIDSTEYPITHLLSTGGSLYIRKDDKPYYLDTLGNVKVLTDITESLYSAATAGGAMYAWLGKIFMAYGTQSLLMYDSTEDTFEWVQPANFGNGLSLSRVYAITGDDQYLYIAVKNDANKTYILAGRDENIDGTSSWVWHTVSYHATVAAVGAMSVFTATSYKYLLLSSTSVTTLVAYYISQNYSDIVGSEAIGYYHNGGMVITPWLHGEFKADTKALIAFTGHLGHLYAADAYWTAWYQLWSSTTWVSLGNLVGTATDRSHTLYFSSTTRPSTPFVRFKFVAAVGAAYAPVLLDYSVKVILYPSRRSIYKMIVRVADNIKDRQGQPLLGKKDLKDTLTEAKDSATTPFVWYDIDGATRYGRILPADPFYKPQTLEASTFSTSGKTVDEFCYLNIQEIKYS